MAQKKWRALHTAVNYTNNTCYKTTQFDRKKFARKKNCLTYPSTDKTKDKSSHNVKFDEFLLKNIKQKYSKSSFQNKLKDDVCLWITGVLAASSILVGHKWLNRGQQENCPVHYISVEKITNSLDEHVHNVTISNVLPEVSCSDEKVNETSPQKSNEKFDIALKPVFDDFQKSANECVGTLLYEYGLKYTKKNLHKKAFQMYQTASEYDNVEAVHSLGSCYENGLGVKKSLQKAIHFYGISASKGNVNSMFQLGLLYYNDLIDDSYQSNQVNAMSYMKKAANSGMARAQLFVGLRFAEMDRFSEAFAYFEMASKQEDVIAIFNLAKCYENGFGVTKNVKKALKLYFQAAKFGNILSIKIIGDSYYYGRRGLPRDLEKSLKWYKCALEEGHLEAQTSIEFIQYELAQENEQKFLSFLESRNEVLDIMLPFKETVKNSFHKSSSLPILANISISESKAKDKLSDISSILLEQSISSQSQSNIDSLKSSPQYVSWNNINKMLFINNSNTKLDKSFFV